MNMNMNAVSIEHDRGTWQWEWYCPSCGNQYSNGFQCTELCENGLEICPTTTVSLVLRQRVLERLKTIVIGEKAVESPLLDIHGNKLLRCDPELVRCLVNDIRLAVHETIGNVEQYPNEILRPLSLSATHMTNSNLFKHCFGKAPFIIESPPREGLEGFAVHKLLILHFNAIRGLDTVSETAFIQLGASSSIANIHVEVKPDTWWEFDHEKYIIEFCVVHDIDELLNRTGVLEKLRKLACVQSVPAFAVHPRFLLVIVMLSDHVEHNALHRSQIYADDPTRLVQCDPELLNAEPELPYEIYAMEVTRSNVTYCVEEWKHWFMQLATSAGMQPDRKWLKNPFALLNKNYYHDCKFPELLAMMSMATSPSSSREQKGK